MNQKRTDFKTKRNKEIYKEYVDTEASYNDLAKKYNLSSQRINAIVKDMMESGYGKTLCENDKREKRDLHVKHAESLREQGNLSLAADMLEQVVNWDKMHGDYTDLINVYGHLRILYTHIGDNKKSIEEKKEYYLQAEKSIEDALEIADIYPKAMDEGLRAIILTHLTSCILKTTAVLDQKDKKNRLEKALEHIDYAIKNIAGSQAHKSWPKNAKSQVLIELGRKNEAFKLLQDAENDVFLGYTQELKYSNGDLLKLKVWLCGIYLTLARLSLEMNRPMLAHFYSTAVLNIEDMENNLNHKKDEAKKTVSKVKSEL